ncbi:hypothetical protein E4U59_000323, partial [Claviceps monticola]
SLAAIVKLKSFIQSSDEFVRYVLVVSMACDENVVDKEDNEYVSGWGIEQTRLLVALDKAEGLQYFGQFFKPQLR